MGASILGSEKMTRKKVPQVLADWLVAVIVTIANRLVKGNNGHEVLATLTKAPPIFRRCIYGNVLV